MLFEISVVVCLNILVYLTWCIRKILKTNLRKSFIDRLQNYADRRN